MSTILVVDDDPATVHLVTSLLEGAGHRAIGQTRPQDIQGILERERIDGLVLDMVMPGMTGIEVVAALRKSRHGTTVPILILSGKNQTDLKVASLRAGADDYMTKPFETSELVARIERLIQRTTSQVALAGQLRRFAVTDLLQSLTQSGQTGVLSVDGGTEIAYVIIRDGMIVSASAGGLSDREALLWLADWTDGFFSFEDSILDIEDESIDPPLRVNSILLESVWLSDEIEKRRKTLPALDQVLERGEGELPATTRDNEELPFQAVLDLVDARPVCTLRELLQSDLAAPSRVRLAVIELILSSAVRIREILAGQGRANAPSADGDDSALFENLRKTLAGAGADATNTFVLIHATPSARSDIVTFASSLPWGLTSARSEQFFEQLTSRGSSLLRFRDNKGQTVLSFRLLTSVPTSGQRALISLAHAVILWLGDAEEDLGLVNSYAPVLDRGRSQTLGLVVAPDHRHDPIASSLHAHPRWQLATTVPSRLPTLVDLLHDHRREPQP